MDLNALDNDDLNDNFQSEKDFAQNYIKGEGEPAIERPTMDGFFHFNDEIINIQRTMRGFELTGDTWYYTGKPLARDEFINYMINSIRSIVNQSNYLAKLEEDEVFTILDEKNTEFIYAAYDEPTIKSTDIEKVVNLHDHMLELFLKTVRDGIGRDSILQLGATTYRYDDTKNNDPIDWKKLGIVYGGKNK